MLKKISSLAAGGYGYHSSSRPLQVRRRSLDDDQLRRHSQTNPNDDSGTDGSQPEAEGLKNAMDMLIAENKHLKTLIQERDARASSFEREDLEALRKECAEANDEVARLRQQLDARGEIIESMKRERLLQSNEGVQELHEKIKLLEAQLEFECKNHVEELEEKEARIAELEMQVLDAQHQSSGEALSRQEHLNEEEKQQREELKSQLAMRVEEVSRKDAEINRLQAELEATRGAIAKERTEQQTSSEDDERAKDLSRRITILEAKLCAEESKRIAAEEALALQRDTAGETDEGKTSLEQLRREIKEKDAALQGMSQQLLEVSAEKDELEQQLQKLREAPSAPETPRALTTRRSFFGRSKSTALERDALAAQVQHLEEQLQKLTDKRVELERTRVKLEGQLAESVQDVRQARKEKADLEMRLREREAALEALRAAHADIKKPLDVPQNITLPLPQGRQDAGLEATAQLVLKDGVIKTLSSRIAFLQFSLEEVTAEKEKLLSQPATVALQQQLQEAKKELVETSAKYRGVVTQRAELREKVEALTKEAEKARREITSLKAALDESQARLTTTADKFKEQTDRYRSLVSSSLSKIEDLQDEVSRERNSKILVGKVYRQEMLELRKAAVHVGGVPGDPLRPLSSAKEEQHERMQVSGQPTQDPIPHAKAPPSHTGESQEQRVLSAPLRDTDRQAPAVCCPFSGGIPVAVTAPRQQADFAVIPLCYPAKVAGTASGESNMHRGSLAREKGPKEQHIQVSRVLHAYVNKQQDDSSCTEGVQKPQAALPNPAFQEPSAASLTTASLKPKATSPALKPASIPQPPSTGIHTQQETPFHQQFQTKKELLKAAGDQQQDDATAALGQYRPPERAGSVNGPTRNLLPRQECCEEADIPTEQELGHLEDYTSASAERSSSSKTPPTRTQMLSGSDSLDAATDGGDVEGTAAAPAPLDGTTILRDLQQIQSKKKVLFTPGLSTRGSPVLGNPFEAEEDSIVDLS